MTAYGQKHGCAMGLIVSATVVNLYVEELDRKVTEQH